MNNNESCLCCMSRPRAVRNQPCGHGAFCELCTSRSVQADGLITCAYARCVVRRLVVMPTTPTAEPPRLKRIRTYQAEPEPEGDAFESFDAFLQAKLGSDDAEVAEAARVALARVSGQREEEEVGEEEEEEVDVEEYPLFPIDAQGHATVPEGETELPEKTPS